MPRNARRFKRVPPKPDTYVDGTVASSTEVVAVRNVTYVLDQYGRLVEILPLSPQEAVLESARKSNK